MNEQEFLDSIAKTDIYAVDLNIVNSIYSSRLFLRARAEGNILELGPAEGPMTDILYPFCKQDYTIVDGSQTFADKIKQRHPGINSYASLFEDFSPSQKYSNIVLCQVLEHVADPTHILQLCKSWLADNGIIYATVPNANSLHRQLGLQMGMLQKLDELNEGDKQIGHRRVFFMDSFVECFNQAGLSIVHKGGYFLKPLTDHQMYTQCTKEQLDAFFSLGEKHPDIAGIIYVIATH